MGTAEHRRHRGSHLHGVLDVLSGHVHPLHLDKLLNQHGGRGLGQLSLAATSHLVGLRKTAVERDRELWAKLIQVRDTIGLNVEGGTLRRGGGAKELNSLSLGRRGFQPERRDRTDRDKHMLGQAVKVQAPEDVRRSNELRQRVLQV